MFLEKFFLPVLEVLDISSGFNPAMIGSFFLITMLGEINLQIPLLMESMLLLIGYQSRVNNTAVLNATLILLAAQVSRQISMLALYLFFPVINRPLSKLLMKAARFNRFSPTHFDRGHFDARCLSSLSATLGMLTWLNLPLKLLLIWRRRLRPLLVGTLLSGLVFDGKYLLAGAVFHATELNIVYLPVVFLAVFLVFMYVQIRMMKNVAEVR